MKTVGIHDQIKKGFQDIIAPEIHTLRADINGIRIEMVSIKAELLAEIRRLDARIIRERLAALEARRSP